mmetsp:Transcript_50401/g.90118  ORF Transcript_50401/g.90118 Transcript_50401/m.90118 type:complete len:215 (-) Transcript_50401:1154-1798(-)
MSTISDVGFRSSYSLLRCPVVAFHTFTFWWVQLIQERSWELYSATSVWQLLSATGSPEASDSMLSAAPFWKAYRRFLVKVNNCLFGSMYSSPLQGKLFRSWSVTGAAPSVCLSLITRPQQMDCTHPNVRMSQIFSSPSLSRDMSCGVWGTAYTPTNVLLWGVPSSVSTKGVVIVGALRIHRRGCLSALPLRRYWWSTAYEMELIANLLGAFRRR